MRRKIRHCLLIIILLSHTALKAEDGYELWLRYSLVTDQQKLNDYRNTIKGWLVDNNSPTAQIIRKELQRALTGLLGKSVPEVKSATEGTLLIGTANAAALSSLDLKNRLKNVGPEGFVIFNTKVNNKNTLVIAANEDAGMLYGVFHFLRMLQTHQPIGKLAIESTPKTKVRILNHWDNLDRTVERGYAGFSLWDWHKLPDHIDPRYHDYARANASIGINGTVLTNVNANALILTPAYLKKVTALADLFRPYGIRVYLTARFSAPIEIGGLKTADPLDAQVQEWWKRKVAEIYKVIPDFGGFLVKANSEGQPGPQNYNRNHADGANMLADAVKPFNGIVMWRAFVYDNNVPVDRTKQAYNEFKPLDGTFRGNVMVQVKNGPLDFQPREPFHPLFGAMPSTPLMMEFQITQEYLGFATHLVYLAPLFKECLDADTHAKGKGSTVARVIDGSLENHTLSGMAGVANIGNDRNWCGHPVAQSNWYSFGRLAWDHTLSAEAIADEWVRMTFSNNVAVVSNIKNIMIASRDITVKYMTPLGLHHIMGWNHHYGPGPWIKDKPRADWTSVYYHQAEEKGIGFNRTTSGSNALEQYQSPVQQLYSDPEKCDERYLLWFHHVSWDRKMKSGRTLWDELCHQYYQGADSAKWMQQQWNTLEGQVDDAQFRFVKSLLNIQQQEAVWWRNACVLYFQTFSKKPIPPGFEKPDQTLQYYEQLEFPFAPGIRPRW
ncbi:alpha-glucuronidase [Fulvivirgaceae bacterium PWU4]|uniref:Xylan alpha-1,2-glucuronidase n=1 Tax=Chryseosolibacter histidini TaxID=2782349 RepID=A0AAP2DFY5_9BACT|nr:alpha-glucuronidase family glycosyl hydrolase [Chryseosolibacter histidini]MBT1695630.1 alpha-glucuronidase [Chryseosolibacter histidini]